MLFIYYSLYFSFIVRAKLAEKQFEFHFSTILIIGKIFLKYCFKYIHSQYIFAHFSISTNFFSYESLWKKNVTSYECVMAFWEKFFSLKENINYLIAIEITNWTDFGQKLFLNFHISFFFTKILAIMIMMIRNKVAEWLRMITSNVSI